MGKVAVYLTMSLDGFIAGPNDSEQNPLGDGGERLFTWMNSGPPRNRYNHLFCPPDQSRVIMDEWFADSGAFVAGRRTFDIAHGWGGHHPVNADAPIFVLTHHVPTAGSAEASMATFVTDGIESAIRQAKAVAGDKTIGVCAANVVQQCIKAGLLDEIQISLVPILLGGGVRLFDRLGTRPHELTCIRVIESVGVTHLRYRLKP